MLGLGISGMSMVRWLTNRGATVRVADTRLLPPFAEQLRTNFPDVDLHVGELEEHVFAGTDVVAISPGVPLAQPLVFWETLNCLRTRASSTFTAR